MEGVNKVILVGNVGADPELRQTQSGESVLNLRVATNERYQDRQQQWQEKTEWHTVTVWGKRADALSKFLGKGQSVYIEGGLRTSSYEKDGVKRYKTEIVARQLILTGGGSSSSGSGRSAGGGAPAGGEGSEIPPDDDIPF